MLVPLTSCNVVDDLSSTHGDRIPPNNARNESSGGIASRVRKFWFFYLFYVFIHWRVSTSTPTISGPRGGESRCENEGNGTMRARRPWSDPRADTDEGPISWGHDDRTRGDERYGVQTSWQEDRDEVGLTWMPHGRVLWTWSMWGSRMYTAGFIYLFPLLSFEFHPWSFI